MAGTEPELNHRRNGHEQPAKSLLVELFSETAHSYDRMVRMATLGMDLWWKRQMINILPSGKEFRRILDIGCGTGISTFALAKRFPEAEIVGIDLASSYLDVAREKSNHKGFRKINWIHMPAEELADLDGEFDLMAGSYMPKLIDLEKVALSARNKLEIGGSVVMHDFIVPISKLLRMGFMAHWQLVRLIMRISPGWLQTSQNLFRIIWESHWPDRIEPIFAANGFGNFKYQTQPLQVARIMHAERTS